MLRVQVVVRTRVPACTGVGQCRQCRLHASRAALPRSLSEVCSSGCPYRCPSRCPSGFSPMAGTSSTGTPIRGYQSAGSCSYIERRISRWCSRARRARTPPPGSSTRLPRVASTPSAGQSGCPARIRRATSAYRTPCSTGGASTDRALVEGGVPVPGPQPATVDDATAAATPWWRRRGTAPRSRPTTVRRRPRRPARVRRRGRRGRRRRCPCRSRRPERPTARGRAGRPRPPGGRGRRGGAPPRPRAVRRRRSPCTSRNGRPSPGNSRTARAWTAACG